MRLAQGALKLLSECPRRFQYVVLEQGGELTPPELQQRLDWGKQFHQLVEQWELGLSVGEDLEKPLKVWWQAFQGIQGQLQHLGSGGLVIDRAVELEQTLLVGESVLVGVYDLLLLGELGAEIVDWKTYGRPGDVEGLREDWQTRLYLYLLAENSAIAPENLAMTYWFLGGKQPQSWRLVYDAAQHEATKVELQIWLNRLAQWLGDYEQGRPFPQVDRDRELCPTCPFSRRCDRGDGREAGAIDQLELIPEVPLA
jgi:PD-(D/E)XK nuclease superfamily